jgi:nitroreductase
MVRDYAREPVDPAVVELALANARRAPSAGFSQGWGFLVLDTPHDVARFWDASTPASANPGSAWLRGMRAAPVVVVPHAHEAAYRARYAEPDKSVPDGAGLPWAVPYWHVDAGMASLLILQTAVDAGLGACFFGIPADRVEALRREFGVPPAYEPVGAITIGHPAAGEKPRGSAVRRWRRPTDEVVHRGRWRSSAAPQG